MATTVQQFNQKISRPAWVPSRPLYTVACLVATDAVALLLSVAISLFCKFVVNGGLELGSYLRLWPFLFAFLLVYSSLGLYSGVALSPPDELRRAMISSALVFLGLAAVTVSLRGATRYFTWTLYLAIVLSVVFLPILRALVRLLFAEKAWWGYPAVVFGAGDVGQSVVRTLTDDPGIGLKPIAVVDPHTARANVEGVPVADPYDLAAELARSNRFTYAIIAANGQRGARIVDSFEAQGFSFSHIIYIADIMEYSSLWVVPRSVGSMLGLEVCHQFLLKETLVAKRALDLLLTIVGGLIFLPVIALLYIAIRLDSAGPAFYGQRRVGRGGKEFKAWKFRSMIPNADHLLETYFEQHPELRAEWERDHKLRNDPRVTRVGRFLRKTSLDELPQIWNVLKGEMSLVGPRPIVRAEVDKYGSGFDLYTKVKSGLTGLWQVSGRNDTSYEERVRLDSFYVRNWSVWFDLCILFRTIGAVLLRKGAY